MATLPTAAPTRPLVTTQTGPVRMVLPAPVLGSTAMAPASYVAYPGQVMTQPQVKAGSVVYMQPPITTSTGTAPRVMLASAPAAPPVIASRPPVTYVQSATTSGVVPTVISPVTTPVTRTIQVAPTVVPSIQVQTRPHTLAGPGYTQGHYEAKHSNDPVLANLKELRKTSGLKQIPVDDGLRSLKTSAVDGKLTREQFLAAYGALLEARNIEVPNDEVRNAVFDLFDRDENNIVDMMELICGISLLCSGSEDDKIHAVFNVFDENGDGFISMDEMFKFLTSVFKVVLTPNVLGVMNSMGVTVESAEDLASVTSLECFKTADLNHDGKLSITEFKTWFYAPRNDPSFLFSPVRKLLA